MNFKKIDLILILIYIIIFSTLLIPTLRVEQEYSPDGEYLFQGYLYLTTQNSYNYAMHGLLPGMIGSIPLLFMNIEIPKIETIESPREFGLSDFLYYRNNNPNKIIFWSKIPLIIMGIFIGLIIFLWSLKLYGRTSAYFSLILYTFNLTILNYTKTFDQDFLTGGFYFLSIFLFWLYFKRKKKIFLWGTAISTGLTFMTKITTIILIPSFAIILILNYSKKNIENYIKIFTFIILISSVTFIFIQSTEIHPIYNFNDPLYKTSNSRSLERFNEILEDYNIENSKIKKIFKFAVTKIPIPAPHFFEGIYTGNNYIKKGETGSGYLLGEYPQGSKFIYYLLGFLIKTQIPLIIFLAIIFIKLILNPKNLIKKNNQFLFIPPTLIISSFIFSKMYGGIRYLIPAYPFIFVYTGSIIKKIKFKKLISKFLVIILILWYVFSCLQTFPEYQTYYNEFIKNKESYVYSLGTDHTNKQNFIGLIRYINQQNYKNEKIYLNISKYYNFKHRKLENMQELPGKTPTEGIIILSIDSLYGNNLKNKEDFKWIQDFKPIDKYSNNFLIYNITKENLKI